MKRILTALTALLLLLTVVGAPIADAKGASGGGSRGGSSFSSSKSTSTTKSTPAKAAKTEKTAKTSKHTAPAQPTAAQINSFKHKPAYSTPYTAPPANSTYNYENKRYYDRNSGGLMTTLATSIGTYLVLDAILDDGEPVYIDSETGEQIDADDLDELTADQDAQDDSSDFWGTVIMGLLVVVVAMLFLIFR